MKTKTIPASQSPSRQPIGRKVNNLVKLLTNNKPVHQCYRNESSFNPQTVKSQIRMFCREAANRITTDCVVSVNVDQIGANINVVSDEFTFSFSYMEGGKA